MQTILIAQRSALFAETLAAPLRSSGYRVITCPGPWPPALHCIRCETGDCPLTEAAYLMIYDPNMVAYDDATESHELAVESARAHPDVPMLLAWPPDWLAGPSDEVPANVEHILRTVPNTRLAESSLAALVQQVDSLLRPGRAQAVAPLVEHAMA
jgi:hypothetical protein